jgi:iron complex transport system permease protein
MDEEYYFGNRIGYFLYILLPKGKALNAMMLGEKDAQHLGINVERLKKQIILITALMVGSCVAFSGTIGFVGLIVPYILRFLFKSDYAVILPLSAVCGSILLLTADTFSRSIVEPSSDRDFNRFNGRSYFHCYFS